MAYTNIQSVKTAMGIDQCNEVNDAKILSAINDSTNIINEWLGRDLTRQTFTEYYKGNGQQYLPLNNRPVTLLKQTCTLNGTTTVTVEDSSKMIVGMPVCGTNPTPVNNPTSPAIVPGTTIASKSGNTITLSQAANASGSQTLFFGLQVWVSENCYWGQAAGPFPPQTALTPGADFALDLDVEGSSRSGLLYSINFYWPIPWNYQPGTITPVLGPADGNVKVSYTAGYNPVPGSLERAANLLVAKMLQISNYGQTVQSESVTDYSYTLGNSGHGVGIITKEIGQLLSSYKNLVV